MIQSWIGFVIADGEQELRDGKIIIYIRRLYGTLTKCALNDKIICEQMIK